MPETSKYSALIENMPDGYAHHLIITDSSGKPVDFIFLEANAAFESIMGLSRENIIGKKATEVEPFKSEYPFDWIGIYGEVALTGKPFITEQYFRKLDRWFYISAFSYGLNYFSVILHDITHRKKQEKKLKLNEPVISLSKAKKLEETLRLSLNAVLDNTEFDSGGIYLEDEESGDFVLQTHKGLSEDFIASVLRYGKDTPQIKMVLEGKPVYSHYSRLGIKIDPIRVSRQLQAIALVPIAYEERVIACLNLASHRVDTVRPDDKMTVETLANQIGSYIARSRSEEELKKNESFIKTVMDNLPIGVAVNSVNPQVMFEYMNDRFFEIYRTTRKKLDENDFWLSVYEDEIFREKLKKRVIDDCNSNDPKRMIWENIPLVKGDETYYISASNIPLPDKDLMLSTVWDVTKERRAEVALKEAHRQLQEEICKAEAIHQKVLPSELPQTETISLAGYNRPAVKMGGDSYNVIRSGKKMVLYVADVMGHGLDGAMLSVFIKEAIDSYVVLKPEALTPQKILAHLNSQYRREGFPDHQLIAIFLAVLDMKTYEFRYSSAGFQTKPLIIKGDGSRDYLDSNGLFISNSVPPEMVNFKESSLILTPGTTILMVSDGLAEHDNGSEMYRYRYHEIFYENSHLPPEVILQAVNKDFCYFNNNSLTGRDDITCLVLQYGRSAGKRYSIKINSEFNEMDNLYKEIRALTNEFPEPDKLMTCLHEIVVNAIEHGNKFDSAKTVKIDITVNPHYVLFEVADEGEGFNWCEKLDKPVNMETYSERGRGIALTGLMAGNLYYNQKGNKATLLVQCKNKEVERIGI